MEVACCFIEFDGKILVVARQNSRTHKNEWDIPADKVDDKETSKEAAARIVVTETGYHFMPNDLQHLGDFEFVSGNSEPYIMHAFRADFGKSSQTDPGTLFSEWITPSDCLERTDLIKNFAHLLKLVGYSE
jgi:ADP-ribose pyrophosphatase YjhB (NUDIX family)